MRRRYMAILGTLLWVISLGSLVPNIPDSGLGISVQCHVNYAVDIVLGVAKLAGKFITACAPKRGDLTGLA